MEEKPLFENLRLPCWRPAFRKIANGFRTIWGAKLYAEIQTFVQTARRRPIGALEAIRLTLADKRLPIPA